MDKLIKYLLVVIASVSGLVVFISLGSTGTQDNIIILAVSVTVCGVSSFAIWVRGQYPY